MTLLGRKKLTDFITSHADARSWIETWIAEVEGNQWKTSQDIKDRYSSVSFLADNVVIFNVKGNSYRLEIQVAYRTGKVIVRWIGTHAEYDKRYK